MSFFIIANASWDSVDMISAKNSGRKGQEMPEIAIFLFKSAHFKEEKGEFHPLLVELAQHVGTHFTRESASNNFRIK